MGSNQIVIIGAGISGSVLAERYASVGKKVLMIEKRNHLGGNCFDYINKDGILVSEYGAHLFHTNYKDVWQYVQQFSDWVPHKHKVLAFVDGELVSVPVNITTVNKIFNLNIQNEQEMRKWLEKNQLKLAPGKNPKNSEEVILNRVGRILYEKLFKNYTKKQWDKYPTELNPSVLARIPVRNNFEDGYFSDKYQAQPVGGFTRIFEKMLNHPNIRVMLSIDFFKIKDQLGDYEKLFYTGPIDRFFNNKKLEYRSLDFQFETFNQEFFQENSVINYPNDFDFTRIVEYKYITGQKHSKTTISKEYSRTKGEPYYPVPTLRNQRLYKKYKRETEGLKNVYFVGRLAEYKYINMDEAFKNALDLFERLEN